MQVSLCSASSNLGAIFELNRSFMQWPIMSAQEEKQVEWDKMERFLAGEKCRRIFLDAEMDGRGLGLGCDERGQRVRCEEGEERCDVCEQDDVEAEGIYRRRTGKAGARRTRRARETGPVNG